MIVYGIRPRILTKVPRYYDQEPIRLGPLIKHTVQNACDYWSNADCETTMARILIVDDDPGVASMLVEFLESNGHLTHVEFGGERAIAYAERTSPDAIILDLMLPVVTGAEAAQRLRRNPETSSIPIVAITSLDRPEELAEILMVDDLLPKPFDLDVLDLRIRTLTEMAPNLHPGNAEDVATLG